jgi:PKD repeat protein
MTLRLRLAVVPALAVACLVAVDRGPLSLNATSGIVNEGFEDGTLDGLPSDWSATAPETQGVKVVDAEGPGEFPTYADMGNVTVSPYRGDRMLRLGGVPRQIAQHQDRGAYAASQVFTPGDTTIQFAFRLFSWEHRGTDELRFNLFDGTGSVGALAEPIVIDMAGGDQTCTALPCIVSVDVGANGQFVDSGWQPVEIVSVPQGTPLTITYAVVPSGSESHATWAYFDSAEELSEPPVAVFSFTPAEIFEGDTVQFLDGSYEPDAGDDVVDWEWEIDGQTINAQNPLYIFPDEGTYPVRLTVTSSDGSQVSVVSGEAASDGTPIPEVVVQNADPLVNALNVEALPGVDAPIVARFVDPGWLDSHTAGLTVGGSAVAATLQEDNNPAYGSGIVEGVASALSSASGDATVNDEDGGSGSDTFTFTVVPDDPLRHEPNNDLLSPPVLESDGSYLSYIQTEGDIDIFEVKLPGNRALPAGSEVLVTLRDLPAAYDVVLLTLSADGTVDPGDSGEASFNTAPFTRSPFTRSPFTRSPFTRSPFTRSPFTRSPFTRSGFTFDQLPLSQLAFTGLDGDEIIGTDIGLGELGLSAFESAGVRIAGFSANRGIETDVALGRTSGDSERMFIAIVGENGEFHSTPYRVQVEASAPLDLETLLGSAACTGTPLVGAPDATNATVTLFDGAGGTLYVTQRERMRAVHDLGNAEWDALLADLVALAQTPAGGGDIISLPSVIYDTWDVAPCSIEAANNVTDQIAAIIAPLLPSLENVVFVGDDGIVPFRREPDETAISNERDYIIDSFLRPGSPEFARVALGYNTTDDFYTDFDPIAWQGRHFYVPDVASGRLIETPDEIRAQAQAFVASNGQLDVSTGFVSGYDFFTDGAQAMFGALAGAVPTTNLINDSWTSDDLRCLFLGLDGCTAHSISAANAHFTHYAALSAAGFTNIALDDFLGSSEVPGSGLGPNVLAFSMGCHAGLNVADRDSESADPGLGVDPALDYAQAMARQRAVFVASTGFGLGDDVTIGGTELLLSIYAQHVAAGGVSAGGALVTAKQSYVNGLADKTVYDEKSAIQTTLYGLPMYQVAIPAPVAPTSVEGIAAAGVPSGLELTVIDGTSTTQTVPYAQVSTEDGDYVTAAGSATSTVPRAIQPKFELPISPGGVPVHSAILYGGAYEDNPAWDPVLARSTTEWEVNAQEPRVCLQSFWPASLSAVNTLATLDGLLQSVVFTSGQFMCQSAPGDPVTGLQRLYSSLTFELLRCDSDDYVQPTVHSVDLLLLDAGTVQATIDATDASGIVRIVGLKFGAGTITPTYLDTTEASSPYVIEIDDVGPSDTMVFLIQDGACNVTWATGKGSFLKTMLIDAGADKLYVPDEPATFTTKVFAIDTLTEPLYFEWDFGDGAVVTGTLQPGDLIPDGLGNVTFDVEHTYSGLISGSAQVTVLDAAGAIAVDVLGVGCDDTSDADADGLDVCSEVALGTDPADSDSDDDTLRDGDEVHTHGSNPLSPDTDDDAMSDPYEVSHACLFVATNDATGDPDADAVGSLSEQGQLTDPCDPDTDDDGFKDKRAVPHDTQNTNPMEDNCVTSFNPTQTNTDGNTQPNGPNIGGDDTTNVNSDAIGDTCDVDDDNDGFSDMAESAGSSCTGVATNTLEVDTDGDHLTDKWECQNGSDPTDPGSHISGAFHPGDADADGVLDLWEMRGYDSSTSSGDSDGDGCSDAVEIASVNGDLRVDDADRIAVGRRSIPIWPFDADQDYILDVSKNGTVGDEDRLMVARIALGLAGVSNVCP